ncbi:hypothetical protein DIS24_g6229 [Lasiodiplodia hormozganensis]|uniref:Uncharacterized protein n=1 Tax=Lasiodiplodia hormozganensis TaxID=869390 RepID=A0AA39YIG0_9PEZI|nr:hypothetical protein DIS24_g6229 [Lasiodiplodia hormozganensis]
MSAQLKPLGDWVDQLLHTIFFQPDDNTAIKAYTESVDPSFLVRINHDKYNFDQYKEAVNKARAQSEISLRSTSEILKWDDAEQKGGTVAHLTKFTVKDKATGQETHSSSLILSAVRWINGKRVLTEMTEVTV